MIADNNRGIILFSGSGHSIDGNLVGTLANGTTAAGNGSTGIELSTDSARVGVAATNVVAHTIDTDGNGQGIAVQGRAT